MTDKARTNRKRQFGVGLVLALLMMGVILLPGANTTSAQSTGAFGGAILDLVPTNPNPSTPNTTNTIAAVTSGAAGTSFFIQGLVFQNRAVQGDCSISPINGDPVGQWTMWGVRNGATLPAGAVGDPVSNSGISAGNIAFFNMSVELRGFNGTLHFQGTLGRVFGAIESAGHPATDLVAIVGGTGTFRSASGDGVITPFVLNGPTSIINGSGPCPATSAAAGAFQLFLKEGNRFPRFSNLIPSR
jgi:hypothetical protein